MHIASDRTTHPPPPFRMPQKKGGLSLRGTRVAVTTETAKTVTVVSWHCILQDKQKEGKVLSRTAKTVKTAKTVMKANPP